MNKELAIDQIASIYECAERAGIRDYVFIAYGTLLGAIREGGFIGHDSDSDIGVQADRITKEQEQAFYHAVIEAGLYEYRKRYRDRKDTGRILWTSLKKNIDGNKNCIWFHYPWRGYYWHTKGGRWVTKIGRRRNLPLDYKKIKAISKGIPESYLRDLIPFKFCGLKVNIPLRYGSCLDAWYPDWKTPRKGGSSKCEVISTIGDWADERTWNIMVIENY